MTAPPVEGCRSDSSAATSSGPARGLRVSVLAGGSLLLAATGHLVGGGSSPSAGRLLTAAVLLALVAGIATARRCRLPVLVPLLVAEQALLHFWFTATTAGCGGVAGGHHGITSSALAGCAPPPPSATEPTPWAMWLGHLAATLVTAWLLARGEAWLWRTADEIVAAADAAPTVRSAARTLTSTAARSAEVARRAFAPAAPRGPPHTIALS